MGPAKEHARGAASAAEPAHPALRLIEVKVIGVERVVVRRKGRAENVAGSVARGSQETRVCIVALPVAQDRYAPPVG